MYSCEACVSSEDDRGRKLAMPRVFRACRNLKEMKCPHNLKHAKFVAHEILEEAGKL